MYILNSMYVCITYIVVLLVAIILIIIIIIKITKNLLHVWSLIDNLNNYSLY